MRYWLNGCHKGCLQQVCWHTEVMVLHALLELHRDVDGKSAACACIAACCGGGTTKCSRQDWRSTCWYCRMMHRCATAGYGLTFSNYVSDSWHLPVCSSAGLLIVKISHSLYGAGSEAKQHATAACGALSGHPYCMKGMCLQMQALAVRQDRKRGGAR